MRAASKPGRVALSVRDDGLLGLRFERAIGGFVMVDVSQHLRVYGGRHRLANVAGIGRVGIRQGAGIERTQTGAPGTLRIARPRLLEEFFGQRLIVGGQKCGGVAEHGERRVGFRGEGEPFLFDLGVPLRVGQLIEGRIDEAGPLAEQRQLRMMFDQPEDVLAAGGDHDGGVIEARAVLGIKQEQLLAAGDIVGNLGKVALHIFGLGPAERLAGSFELLGLLRREPLRAIGERGYRLLAARDQQEHGGGWNPGPSNHASSVASSRAEPAKG